MVFIDGANLYKGVQDIRLRKPVNIEKLSHKLVGGRELVRIYYYNTPSPSSDFEEQKGHQAFLDSLGWINNLQRRMGRILPKTYSAECPKCQERVELKTHIQKGVDTRIAVDMVTFAHTDAYDVAILISGDSDLAEAVDHIREHTKKKVENACTSRGWAKTLRESADVKIILDAEYLKDCLL